MAEQHHRPGSLGAAGVTTRASAGSARVRSLIVLGIVSSSVAVVLLVAAVDPARTLAILRQAQLGPLALAVGLVAAQAVVRTVRWRLLLGRGDDGALLPFWLVLRALLIGYLGNAALPARLGEAARAGVVARNADRAFGTVLGTIVLERLIDLVALAVLVLAASVFAPGAGAHGQRRGGDPGGRGRRRVRAGSCGAPAGQGRVHVPGRPAPASRRVRAARTGGRAEPGAARDRDSGGAQRGGLDARGRAVPGCGGALGIPMQPGTAVIIAAAGALATAVPAAPGYVGTYDLAAAAVGAAFGLEPAAAVALAAVVHAVAVVPIVLAGAVALISETVSGRSVRFSGASLDRNAAEVRERAEGPARFGLVRDDLPIPCRDQFRSMAR